MAYIPIAEVPNAPANAPEMPLADYPDIPSIRARGIDMKVDMGGRAAALQKQELPGGFAQGLARASAAAGTGQAAMGEAISSGANQMSRAMSGAAGILQKIHNDTLDSEDDIASIKAKDNRETMLNMFNADAVKGEWTEEQKQENLPKYIEKLGQMNSGLGMRQMTRDKIAAQDTSFIHATSYKVEADMYLKKSKDNDDLANGKITTAKERGDAASLADGRDSNDFLHKRGRINDAQYKANDDEMNKSARKSTHMEQVANDPQWAKEQADKAAKGEPNDMFDKTDSPEYVNSIRGHANTELNRVREEKAADLLTEINKGGKNISVEYVNKYADDNHLSNTQRNTLLAAQRDPPIPYDDGRMSEALRLASTYDSTKDKDADGNPSLEDFNKRQNYIVENIPKEYRAELLKDLRASRKETKDGQIKSPQKDELSVADSTLEGLAKAGLLRDPTTQETIPSGETGEGAKKQIDIAKKQASDRRLVQIKRNMRDFIEKNPNFAPNELLDYMNSQVQGIVESNISTNVVRDPKSLDVVSKPRPSYYSTLSVAGSGNLPGSAPVAAQTGPSGIPAPLSPEAYAAKKAGAGATPVGPPVDIHVYDAQNRTFRDAPLPASPELLSQLEREQKLYSTILNSPTAPLREKLNAVGSDVLAPELKAGIVREARQLEIKEGISEDEAGARVLNQKADRAREDVLKTREALKNYKPVAQAVSGFFQGTLAGKENVFIAAANKYGIDPTLLMAISAHETGKGNSDMVRTKNNPGGLYDSKKGEYMTFATPEEGIDAMAKRLKEGYISQGLTTPEQIGPKYAEVGAKNDPKGQNKDWIPGVTEMQKQLRGGSKASAQAGPPPTSAGPIKIVDAVDPTLPALSRPRQTRISKIVVHGDVITNLDKLVSVQKADDRGYHYYIGTDGEVRMVVPPNFIANHIKGANSDSIGIVIAGADNGKMPTAAQEDAAKQLISQLSKQYGISNKNVAGHGERQPDRRDPREGGHIAKDIRDNGFV